jgi:hypothetical protein
MPTNPFESPQEVGTGIPFSKHRRTYCGVGFLIAGTILFVLGWAVFLFAPNDGSWDIVGGLALMGCTAFPAIPAFLWLIGLLLVGPWWRTESPT